MNLELRKSQNDNTKIDRKRIISIAKLLMETFGEEPWKERFPLKRWVNDVYEVWEKAKRGEGIIAVVEDGGEIVGVSMLTLGLWEKEGKKFNARGWAMAVRKGERGKGIGKLLLLIRAVFLLEKRLNSYFAWTMSNAMISLSSMVGRVGVIEEKAGRKWIAVSIEEEKVKRLLEKVAIPEGKKLWVLVNERWEEVGDLSDFPFQSRL